MTSVKKKSWNVCAEVLEYDGYLYSTLDMVAPDELSRGNTVSANAQVSPMPLPPGWELAKDKPGLSDVIKPWRWGGAERLVLADGKALVTLHGFLRPAAPDKNLLVATYETSAGRVRRILYRPHKDAGEARVLMQTVATTADISGGSHCEELFGRVWKKRRFTDFTLRCAGQEMPCHRAVLAEASPVFESALSSNMRESSEKCLEIRDAEPAIVATMLAFLYTGTLDEEFKDHAPLLALADRYCVDGLVEKCSAILLESLSVDNVAGITRALKGLKGKARIAPLWGKLQESLKSDQKLLEALMACA